MAAAAPDLSDLLGSPRESGYRRALEPRVFAFPRDHGPHDGYRNEWWYLTGHLDTSSGRRFGYELTLFRFALSLDPPPAQGSAWATDSIHIGHFAITDVERGAFHVAERQARAAAGLAGAERDPFRVWLYDWSIQLFPGSSGDADRWQVSAADGANRLDLSLVPARPPVLQGDNGLSQKSADRGNALDHHSIPRPTTTGTLQVDGTRYEVSGTSWLDREWSSSALADDQAGWDWFSLQLEDGTDLMYYQLRKKDGSTDAYSAGTLMPPGEAPVPLAPEDVQLSVLAHWDSPAGGQYPNEWRLVVPQASLDLHIRPVLRDQELDTWVRYWEGAVDISGTRGNTPLNGRGYVELTGYARP
ncbi:MAG: lipocalin-like domain-containing protein [Woeseiaceae bacterium]|nr:lipocalin-like domain-containing protein [Woeseiaceae bacterium]